MCGGIKKKMAIIGYGIGNNYHKYKKDLSDYMTLDYLCDARWQEFGQFYDGIPVISPESVKDITCAEVIVFVTESRAYEEITTFLAGISIPYRPLDAVLFGRKRSIIVQLIERAAENNKLADIYDALQDSESRILFDARLKMSLYGDCGELYNALLHIPRTDALLPVSETYYRKTDDDLLGTVQRLLVFQDTAVRKKVVLCRTSWDACVWTKRLGLKIDAVLEDRAVGIDYFPECEKVDIATAAKKYRDAFFLAGDRGDLEVGRLLKAGGIPLTQFKPRHTCWKSQYFDEPFIQPSAHEVFVDAGAYDLNNTFDFIQLCKGKCDKVYAIEPEAGFYEACMKRLEEMDQSQREKIKLLHAAAWSGDMELSFENQQAAGRAAQKVNARSIDSILQGKRVTYIKMDVEGAELEALKGAAGAIKKWRPRLAVCLYHKPEDIIVLPSYILSLRPDYKMYIRHYSTNTAETVLYCL